MRMAADAPMLAAAPVTEQEPPTLPNRSRRKKKLGSKAKKKQTAKFAAKSVSSVAAVQEPEAASLRRAGDTLLQDHAERPSEHR